MPEVLYSGAKKQDLKRSEGCEGYKKVTLLSIIDVCKIMQSNDKEIVSGE